MDVVATVIERLTTGAVAVLGVPWDENSSFLRGCAEAPARIRAVLRSGASNMCAENGHDLGDDARFVDLGDLDLEPGAGERTVARIESAARRVWERGARLLALGGDHAVTYPIVRGRAAVHADLTILHFDAHPDLYDDFDGNRLSHASPFARILEERAARRLVQVGIRTMNPHQRSQAERFGVEVVDVRALEQGALRELALEPPLYVSVDLDVFDPAFAPGVSHHEPGGLTVREVVRIVQDLGVAPVGADVVELNPRRDHEDRTAMVAAKMVKELAARMLGG